MESSEATLPLTKQQLQSCGADRKQLQIKSGVVNRLAKEHRLYKQDAVKQREKVDQLRAVSGEGEWEVKNATRIMEEGEKMVEVTRRQLDKARGDLSDLVVRHLL